MTRFYSLLFVCLLVSALAFGQCGKTTINPFTGKVDCIGTASAAGGASYAGGATGAIAVNNAATPPTVDVVTSVVPLLSSANSFTGVNTFSALKVPTVTALVTADCNEAAEVGRVVQLSNGASGQQWYACEDRGSETYAWTAQGGGGTYTNAQYIPWNYDRGGWFTPSANAAQTELRGPTNGGPRRNFLYFPKAATPANTSIAFYGRIPDDAVTSGNRITKIGLVMGASNTTAANVRMQIEMKCFADNEDPIDGTGKTNLGNFDYSVPAVLYASVLVSKDNPAPVSCTEGKNFWLNITRLATDAGDTTASSTNAYLSYLRIDFARTR